MGVRRTRILGVVIYLAGAVLLIASVVFLWSCGGPLTIGLRCTPLPNWPTYLLPMGSMFVGALLLGRSFLSRHLDEVPTKPS